ncbi:MAG: hypothetical protein JXR03_17910 [Cyclobacteriaceae bacterium]
MFGWELLPDWNTIERELHFINGGKVQCDGSGKVDLIGTASYGCKP